MSSTPGSNPTSSPSSSGSSSSLTRALPSDLLRIKLTVPQAGPTWVRRETLLAWLNTATDVRLTLISAPPGFGKTSLVSQWADHNPVRLAWLSLDPNDNDPSLFWRYIIAACQSFDPERSPGLGHDTLAALRAPAQPDGPVEPASLLTPFLNDLARLTGKSVLVIEDYHVITSPAIHAAFTFWLDHLPPALHVVLLTRADPPLPLGRWRARDQLRELRADALRFTRSEIDTFVQPFTGTTLSTTTLAQTDERLEGWPAGWRMWALLAASTAQGSDVSAQSFVTRFDGQHQHVVDYFTGEVLAHLEPPLREFLLRTAFLGRLNAELCNRIMASSSTSVSATGATAHNSAALLSQLERDNLFLQRLGPDSAQPGLMWYRYHTLFAESLRHLARQHLSEAELRALHTRAGEWFATHGQWPDAIEAALAASASGRAAEYLVRYLDQQPQAPLFRLRPWLEALAPEDLEAQPTLYLNLASAILYTSDRRSPATYGRIAPLLDAAEAHWRWQHAHPSNTDAPDSVAAIDERLGEVLAFRAALEFWQDHFPLALKWARAALELLPAHNAEWRGMCQLDVALDELRQGRLDEVLEPLIEARALCAASGNRFLAMASVLVLGQVSHLRGELHQAGEYYQHVLDEAVSEHMRSDRQIAHIGLGRIARDRGDLALAQSHMSQAIEAGPQLGEESHWHEAMIEQAELQHAQGLPAQQLLHEARAHTSLPGIARMTHLAAATMVLADGDVNTAQRALAALAQLEPDTHLEAEAVALCQTRLLLLQGQTSDAARQIHTWRKEGEAHARNRRVIDWALLEAHLHLTRDDDARARLALTRALALAEPEGILWPWMALGGPLVPLLRSMQAQVVSEPVGEFVTRVLVLLGQSEAGPDAISSDAAMDLPEPLSVQERRVLRLMAAGMTNAEIARELTVSVNTVKSQTQSIYRKLNVNSREAAGEAARRFKLM